MSSVFIFNLCQSVGFGALGPGTDGTTTFPLMAFLSSIDEDGALFIHIRLGAGEDWI
jgi:hypothetical protein